MATLDEISESVAVLRQSGCSELVLLKCTSAYPATSDEMHLATIPDLGAIWPCRWAADHTWIRLPCGVRPRRVPDRETADLSRATPGPDSAFSLEPAEFKAMVDAVRSAARALGVVHYGPSGPEQGSLVFRRSLFVVRDVARGEVFTDANVRCIRPGFGLHARHLDDVLGKRAACDIEAGSPLTWERVESAIPGTMTVDLRRSGCRPWTQRVFDE